MKRIFISLTLILLVLSLTGCSSGEYGVVRNQLDDLLIELNEDAQYQFNGVTLNARNSLMQTMSSLNELESKSLQLKAEKDAHKPLFGFIPTPSSIYYSVVDRWNDKQISKQKVQLNIDTFNYNSAKVNDAVYQTSLRSEQSWFDKFLSFLGFNTNNNVGSKNSYTYKPGGYKIDNGKKSSVLKIIIILLLLLLLFKLVKKFLLRRRFRRYEEQQEEQYYQYSRQQRGNYSGSSNSRLRRACEKYGYDYNEILRKFHEDKQAAYEYIMNRERR